MKIIRKKRFPAKQILVGIILLLVIATPFFYVYILGGNLFGWTKSQTSNNLINNTNNIDYGPASKDQQDAGNSVKSSGSSDTPPAPTEIPGSNKKNVQLTITSKNQTDTVFQIRALISAVENNGTCILTLKNGNKIVTKTAKSQALSTTSTCQGFDVPISELSSGSWDVLIEYNSDTLTGKVTEEIIIN